MYVFYVSFDLLSFIISNTDKHEFSSIWKCISYCNDVMNHGDCAIKCDVYPQKMPSWWINFCSKNICGISKKYISWVTRLGGSVVSVSDS